MKSNNSNGQLTAQINVGDHKKSGFDLSNNVLGTGKLGRIYPTRALHVMPNDTIKNQTKVAVQFEPLAVPMLANMYVKQEHFYCPYNIVWKNWDKFISGGEFMDYQGVVPNVTMKRICKMIFDRIFQDELYLNTYHDGILDAPLAGYSVFNDAGEFTDVLDLIKADLLNVIGSRFAIKDILKEQEEAFNQLSLFAKNMPAYPQGSIIPADKMFYRVYYKSDYDNFSEFWDKYESDYAVTGSKYLQGMKDFVHERMDSKNYYVMPTQLGLQYLQLIYDVVKSFIGIGSNIDYLNMNRLTFQEFLILFTDSLGIPQDNGKVFMGLANLNYSELPMHVLHLRANYSVWYENYRDILLEASADAPQDVDGVGDDELFVLLVPRQRCWEKDAFTTALDNPGTGNVIVPHAVAAVGSSQGINLNATIDKINDIGMYDATRYKVDSYANSIAEIVVDGENYKLPTAFLTGQNPLVDLNSNYNLSGISLSMLDAAQRAQKWLQKALFFGNRITDFYYMRFGVKHLDARLHKPELLASSTELVKLDVVMNNTNITTEAGGEIYQSVAGDRSAYASAYDNGNSYDRFCEEHGVILSYLTIMPQPTYAYGQSRDYSRLDQFDYAFSEFATLGMDAVYDTEISSSAIKRDSKVFGYQGRYYDYKAKHSEEHGELLDSQDMYTFGRRFDMASADGAPKLNYEFVHCFPPLDMFVVDSKLADYFRFDMRHSTAAERLLPAQSIYI